MAINTTYDITISYSGDPLYLSLFQTAADRWEEIVIADIPDINSNLFGFVDDLLIDASVIAIDGAGGILGQAGPDWIRTESYLPFHGVMEFDAADVQVMYSNGTLYDVILHEIGHILGIGTMWDYFGYVNISDHTYTGPHALAEYQLLTGNYSATSVPLESGGGSGTRDSHWSEAVFGPELMTGYVESASTTMPISRITVASLADLGYTVDLSAADLYSLPSGSVPPPVGGDNPGPTDHDLDGDGKSDILWQHDSGLPAIWTMDGSNVTGEWLLPDVAPGWHVAEVADFNGDGRSDILWQHDSGLPAIWTMNGSNVTGAWLLPDVAPGWHVADAADFNGDGMSDILWQHDSGLTAIWTMDGSNVTGAWLLPDVAPGWHVADAADFNGDGMSDILWQHDSGLPAIWTMDGSNVTGAWLLPDVAPGWHVADAADFNGDGRSDILWQHDSGLPAIWTMDGSDVTGAWLLPDVAPGWHVADAADFNGDGRSDILWQHDSGLPAIWTMHGSDVTGAWLLRDPGSGWHSI